MQNKCSLSIPRRRCRRRRPQHCSSCEGAYQSTRSLQMQTWRFTLHTHTPLCLNCLSWGLGAQLRRSVPCFVCVPDRPVNRARRRPKIAISAPPSREGSDCTAHTFRHNQTCTNSRHRVTERLTLPKLQSLLGSHYT